MGIILSRSQFIFIKCWRNTKTRIAVISERLVKYLNYSNNTHRFTIVVKKRHDTFCTGLQAKKNELFRWITSRCQAFTSRALPSCASFHEWNRFDVIHKTEQRIIILRWNEIYLVINDVKCDIFSSIFSYSELPMKNIRDILYLVLKQDTICPLFFLCTQLAKWIYRTLKYLNISYFKNLTRSFSRSYTSIIMLIHILLLWKNENMVYFT